MFPSSFHRLPHVVPVIHLVALLAACGASSEIRPPSTYVGDISSAHMSALYLAAPDNQRLGFDEAFKGFEPQTGLLTDSLPFPRTAVADIVYPAARPAAQYYDANADDNGYLEGPELLVLYVRESAIGLGHTVDYVGVNPRVDALATSSSDVDGLMLFVETSTSRMPEQTRDLFQSLERIGLDWRNRGGSGRGGAR